MSLILAIETSTACGSVALVKDHKLIAVQFYHIEKSHSTLLHVMIQQMMDNAQLALKEVDAIAVAEGPGSYTGLRIGVSAAKGLCFSLDIPLISVNSLEGMAFQVYNYQSEDFLYCPMMDARRMEVYTLLLNSQFELISPTEPVVLEENYLEDQLSINKILFFGDGSDKFKSILEHKHAFFLNNIHPSAGEIGLLGAKKFDNSNFENVVSFEPFYLKDFRIIPSKK
ncbi:MAG: tRNA (adenosine(37)-N6)-threonylcarbamoyltransferase complex dimerization subunit type 1 TsaB [Reichenbachiella sp.]